MGQDILLKWAASLILDGIVLVVSSIAQAQGDLLDEETHLLNEMRPTRTRELIAGRVLARHAMSLLGLRPAPVLMDPHGAPVWPSGLCGSIAHSAADVAVVMARTSSFRSLGVDIEDGRDLGKAAASVASASDTQALLNLGLISSTTDAVRWAFSAKEAVFKCQAPIMGNLDLDFDDVRLQNSPEGKLEALFSGPADGPNQVPHSIPIRFEELQGVKAVIAILV